MSKDGAKEFAPPFVPLGSAQLGIYRIALSSRRADATPPPGRIMLFERTRAGKKGGSWLSTGEQSKLVREEQGAYESHVGAMRAVQEVQRRFFDDSVTIRPLQPTSDSRCNHFVTPPAEGDLSGE